MSYPQDLPIAQGLEIVSIIRKGELSAKKALFAYNLWLLQGFAQKSLLGNPPADVTADGVVLTPSAVEATSCDTVDCDTDAVDTLEKLCLDAQNGTVVAHAAIAWKKLLLWALTELGSMLAKSN